MAIFALQSEGIHDMVYHLLVITQLEVVALFLFVGLLVGDKISLEGCHLALIEEWTVWTTPEIEEVIDGILFLVWVGILLECRANLHSGMMHQFLAAILFSRINLYLFQCSVFVEWTGSMEEQVVVEDGIHTAMLQHGSDMLVQFLAYHK